MGISLQCGWSYSRVSLLDQLGREPSDREIADFFAHDADALVLAGLGGSRQTLGSILLMRHQQLHGPLGDETLQ